jgi:hypothetical protein
MARRNTSRREFWLGHLERCREHGGTLKAYAEANGLAVAGLYNAKRIRAKATPPARATLLPVQLSTARRAEMIRIALPNGVLIEVPSGLSINEWGPLLRWCGQPS